MKMQQVYRVSLLGAASSLVLAGFPALAQDKAGVAGAVKRPTQQISFRTPQATVGRAVASGDEIFLGDRIITGPEGSLQIMLLDSTAFTIGSNASMVIDQFVYDPRTGGGRIAASLVRGSFRVMSGRVARQQGEGITLKTSFATIGVRGSIVGVAAAATQICTALLGVGPFNSADRPPSLLSVTNNIGQSADIARAGWGCCVSQGNPVCVPQPFTLAQLQQLFGGPGGDLRSVGVAEMQDLTGQDLADALKAMQDQNLDVSSEAYINIMQSRLRDIVKRSKPSVGYGGGESPYN